MAPYHQTSCTALTVHWMTKLVHPSVLFYHKTDYSWMSPVHPSFHNLCSKMLSLLSYSLYFLIYCFKIVMRNLSSEFKTAVAGRISPQLSGFGPWCIGAMSVFRNLFCLFLWTAGEVLFKARDRTVGVLQKSHLCLVFADCYHFLKLQMLMISLLQSNHFTSSMIRSVIHLFALTPRAN